MATRDDWARAPAPHLQCNDLDLGAGLPPPAGPVCQLGPHLARPVCRAVVHARHAEGVLVCPLHRLAFHVHQPIAAVWQCQLLLLACLRHAQALVKSREPMVAEAPLPFAWNTQDNSGHAAVTANRQPCHEVLKMYSVLEDE